MLSQWIKYVKNRVNLHVLEFYLLGKKMHRISKNSKYYPKKQYSKWASAIVLLFSIQYGCYSSLSKWPNSSQLCNTKNTVKYIFKKRNWGLFYIIKAVTGIILQLSETSWNVYCVETDQPDTEYFLLADLTTDPYVSPSVSVSHRSKGISALRK